MLSQELGSFRQFYVVISVKAEGAEYVMSLFCVNFVKTGSLDNKVWQLGDEVKAMMAGRKYRGWKWTRLMVLLSCRLCNYGLFVWKVNVEK